MRLKSESLSQGHSKNKQALCCIVAVVTLRFGSDLRLELQQLSDSSDKFVLVFISSNIFSFVLLIGVLN
jgi:hypothetical protein